MSKSAYACSLVQGGNSAKFFFVQKYHHNYQNGQKCHVININKKGQVFQC